MKELKDLAKCAFPYSDESNYDREAINNLNEAVRELRELFATHTHMTAGELGSTTPPLKIAKGEDPDAA